MTEYRFFNFQKFAVKIGKKMKSEDGFKILRPDQLYTDSILNQPIF